MDWLRRGLRRWLGIGSELSYSREVVEDLESRIAVVEELARQGRSLDPTPSVDVLDLRFTALEARLSVHADALRSLDTRLLAIADWMRKHGPKQRTAKKKGRR